MTTGLWPFTKWEAESKKKAADKRRDDPRKKREAAAAAAQALADGSIEENTVGNANTKTMRQLKAAATQSAIENHTIAKAAADAQAEIEAKRRAERERTKAMADGAAVGTSRYRYCVTTVPLHVYHSCMVNYIICRSNMFVTLSLYVQWCY